MTSSTVISWVVTSTLAQTSKLLMIWDDHTSSNIKRLLWYWPKKSFRRISLAYSTVVTDATWKILPQFVKRRQRDFPTFSRYDIFLENPQWLKITKKSYLMIMTKIECKQSFTNFFHENPIFNFLWKKIVTTLCCLKINKVSRIFWWISNFNFFWKIRQH